MTKDLESAERPCLTDVKIYPDTSPIETLELRTRSYTMDTEDTMDCVVMVARKAIEHHRRLH